MSRHSKNNTDGAVFTYHERQQMQHGRLRLRLPGAAHKPWHACALTLQRALHPVLTPQGVLYDREAILAHLLSQKRAMRAAEAAESSAAAAAAAAARRDAAKRVALEQKRFLERQNDFGTRADAGYARGGQKGAGGAGGAGGASQPDALNFWVPGAAAKRRGGATAGSAEPPRLLDSGVGDGERLSKRPKAAARKPKTVCPVTSTALRVRDLLTLNPTPHPSALPARQTAPADRGALDGDGDGAGGGDRDRDRDGGIGDYESSSSESEEDELDDAHGDHSKGAPGRPKPFAAPPQPYICPVCRAVLSNASKPVALCSGTVLCSACADTFVRAERRDPVTDKAIDPDVDMISIHNAGTAFTGSAPGDPGSKEATLYRPSVT